uniref:Eukaryotic translation initiation factor 4E transporter n=1 Tax=Octopus bimaculoides TaxID=37653 RepID=A0A0L8H598_OCTBM
MMEGRNAETKKTDENVQPVPPIHQYSRERLLELKKVPAARSKPLGLSKEFYTSDGVWDPEKWFKAFIASPEGSPLTISDGRERRRPLEIDREFIFRRRLSDPKERLRDDCIVLSPQRRSFGTGCHVTLSGIGRQVSCPPDFKESAQRERTRRIGSGRIQLEKDYNCRYDNRDDRFERNDSGRGDNFRNNYDRRDINPRRINTPNRRRNIRRHEDDPAPEWFTDGPNSKTDTIELRGFENTGEQAEEDMDEVNMPVVNRKEYLSHINEEDIANISVSERNGSLETNESSSPEDSPPSDNVHGTPPQTSPFFDLDEFFKINIPILGMMDGGLEETDVTQGSRFSRWFSQTANHDNNSRRSSIVEETGCIRGSPTNVNVHDASAQLKALLFGKAGRDSVAASPTPGINAYGMPGRVKTVAEIEADLHHQMSPNGMVTVSPLEVPDCSGDMSAFNKLLSMMKAAAVDNSKPHIPDRRSPPNLPAQPPPTIPYLTSGQNEFLHALNRNKEQQLQIQQQTLNQIRMQQQHQHRQHNQEQQQQQQQQKSNQPTPQQQPTPVLQQQPTYVSGVTPTGSGQQTSSDAILNFIKQNPDIIAKPASPNPQLAAVLQHVGHRNLSPGGPPLHPTTSQYLQQNLLSGQPGSVHTSQPRIPSPIMFSQQPPVHLSAPAPVHPGPLVQSSLGQPISNLTSATNIRPHSVLPRVNSPKDMMSFKKDMEEHERFLRKQQERSKSPVSISRGIPTPVNMGPKTSVSVAFTPTSVIRKMHSEKAVEKERQAKQDGCSLNSYSAQKTLMKNQMYIDSVLKDSYSNNVCSDSSRSSPLSLICDKKDIGQGPSVNGHPLPRSQDGLPNQHSGQTPFLSQSHPNLPIDSSIIGGSLNISGSCNSSATPSPSSAKSSKLTPHKGPMSTAGCGEILAAQLFNHEQQNPSPSQTLSSSPCDQSKSLRALMGQGMMQNLTSQLLQSGISNTATSAAQQQLSSSLAGRPIVKVAAMHAQRSAALETRFPGSMRAVYPGVVAPLVQRTSLATTSSIGMTPNPAAAGVVNVGMGQAVSSQIPSSLHKQVSGSSSQKSSSSSLGNMTNTSGADVLKWFDSDSLRTQLPNMPLPPQGQKVFTVDELERNQQAV